MSDDEKNIIQNNDKRIPVHTIVLSFILFTLFLLYFFILPYIHQINYELANLYKLKELFKFMALFFVGCFVFPLIFLFLTFIPSLIVCGLFITVLTDLKYQYKKVIPFFHCISLSVLSSIFSQYDPYIAFYTKWAPIDCNNTLPRVVNCLNYHNGLINLIVIIVTIYIFTVLLTLKNIRKSESIINVADLYLIAVIIFLMTHAIFPFNYFI